MAVTIPQSEKVMVLDVGLPQGGWISVRFAMWFPVAAGNELAQPTFTSSWADVASKDSALLLALRAGTVLEKVYSHDFPAGMSLANVEAFLAAAWTAVNSYLGGVPQPGQFYGTYWDGTAWAKA
jgi:hypothetical protein